jgi:hypothetical protein
MNYAEKLNQTKESYPFARWQKSEIEMYTPENCAAMRVIFDDLIAALIEKGKTASEAEKIELFRVAIERTNELDGETGVVETGEREDLCELTNVISEAAGLNPDKYGGGEGLASEWRDW